MSKRPNILWFSFEDTNPFYGCYGDKVAKTPNLDRLAAEGRRWPLCFSTAGVCAPARSAVITGMYPTSIGTHHMRTSWTNDDSPELPTPYSAVLPHYVKCFSEYFRAAGYYCTNNSKCDYQFDPPSTAWDECSNKAHWRNRPDPDQPFFAVFNPTRTHESGMWEREKEMELTVDPDEIELPPYFPDTPKVRKSMARMYTHIERSDQELGEILQQLEEDGLADNTYVFHWSDHGPLPRGKRWPYDSGIHVPMIGRGPGIEPDTVSEDLVSTVDLGPTMMSLAGLGVPPYMQGKAFLGPDKVEREYVYATRDRYDISYDMIRAIRDKRFKYMRHNCPQLPYLMWIPYRNRHPILQEMYRLHMDGELNETQSVMFQERPIEELYDTDTDPWEINNLASDPAYAEELQRLRGAMDEWRAEVGDMGEIPESEMVRQWYPDGEQPKTATPRIVPICADNHGQKPIYDDASFRGPLMIQLYCATQGASMEYAIGVEGAWQLYTQPLRLESGQTELRTRAIRIGYAPSDEVCATITVTD